MWLTNVTVPEHHRTNIATLSGFCNGCFVVLTLGFYSRSQGCQHNAAALNKTLLNEAGVVRFYFFSFEKVRPSVCFSVVQGSLFNPLIETL